MLYTVRHTLTHTLTMHIFLTNVLKDLTMILRSLGVPCHKQLRATREPSLVWRMLTTVSLTASTISCVCVCVYGGGGGGGGGSDGW